MFGETENTEGMAFTGREFDDLPSEEKARAVRKARLFARVEPAHKSTIVEYLQADGEVSAMVGPGSSVMTDLSEVKYYANKTYHFLIHVKCLETLFFILFHDC